MDRNTTALDRNTTVRIPQPNADASLRHIFNIVRRQKLKLAIFVAVAVAITVALCMVVEPLYEASAVMELERRNGDAVIGQEANQNSPVNDMDEVMTTEIQVVQSDQVLRPVAKKYNLLGLEGQLKDIFGNPLPPDKMKQKLAAPVELKRLKITRPPNTYLLKISYRAANPLIAAEAANAIAQSYLRYSAQVRESKGLHVSELMSRQLAELKTKLEESQKQLAADQKDLSVIDSQQRTTLLANRLNELTTGYTAAQVERMHRQAEMNMVKSGSLAAAQTSTQADILNRLVERSNDAKAHLSEIGSTFGENHPEYQKARNQVAELERQIEGIRANITQRAEHNYQQAAENERMMGEVLAKTKAEFDQLTVRALAFENLKQDADNDKKQYDDLLQRLRDQDINLGYQNSSLHVADMARPGSKPVFPNIPVFLAIAVILSLSMGVGWMVLADAVDSRLLGAETAALRMNVGMIAKLPTFKRSLTLATLRSQKSEDSKIGRSMEWFHESIRTLLSTTLLTVDTERVRTICITSQAPGDGKSTVCCHLALAAAEMRKKTLLIDADVRRGTTHRFFQIPLTPGLSEVLTGAASWRDAVVNIPGETNLDVLSAGRSSRRTMQEFQFAMPQLLEKASHVYDLIIIDAPPVDFAETVHMADMADGVLLVAHAGNTNAAGIGKLISKLRVLEANIIGLVLNHSTENLGGYYYRKYYKARQIKEKVAQ
jgi:capsular exopolysaccharide synthesis family protein